ncbi:UNVERIFIED_CONTAM: hypothetical protein Slati_3977300 [Sesamum latifolium]|uniref:Uncharacterized protein n=1 Tax=Sesamum latifolium TaxID=2727402 RepID=A0AAW2TQ87_9LAMI
MEEENMYNAPVKGVIHTIVGGLAGGDSERLRKKYVRYRVAERSPMVIRMDIANFVVHKILVDNGSSTDILFMDVLRKMEIGVASLQPVSTPLIGFGGSEVIPLGPIDLPVSIGTEPKRKMMMIKFPTAHGIGEVRCDQKEARKCYNLSIKKGADGKDESQWQPSATQQGSEENKKMRIMKRIEMVEELKEIELVPGEPGKTTSRDDNFNPDPGNPSRTRPGW